MRKPASIVILSILFLISPAAVLLFNAALNMVPLFGHGSIIYRLPLQDILILALYPLSALSIYLVRKWGWWVLISSASLMILYNFITLLYNPFASFVLVILMNGALFSVALFFFRKHLIAPYFHPTLRWWEQDKRYEIDIYLKFIGMDRNVIISDISEGGCYIFVDYLIGAGTELPVMIVCGSFHLKLRARVMRIVRESDRYYGYGLMFQKVDAVQKEGLVQLLDKLKSFSPKDDRDMEGSDKRNSSRYYIANDLSLEQGDETMPVNLADISLGGCSVSTALHMEVGSQCLFHYNVDKQSRKQMAHVIWKRTGGDRRFYGLKFSHMKREDRKNLRRIIGNLKKLGAREREADMDDFFRRCDEGARTTPYRIVRKVRGLLGK